jgi:hypothetical protein
MGIFELTFCSHYEVASCASWLAFPKLKIPAAAGREKAKFQAKWATRTGRNVGTICNKRMFALGWRA